MRGGFNDHRLPSLLWRQVVDVHDREALWHLRVEAQHLQPAPHLAQPRAHTRHERCTPVTLKTPRLRWLNAAVGNNRPLAQSSLELHTLFISTCYHILIRSYQSAIWESTVYDRRIRVIVTY